MRGKKVRRGRKCSQIQAGQKGRRLSIPVKLLCCAERWFNVSVSGARRGLSRSLSLKDTLSGAQVEVMTFPRFYGVK